MKKTLRSIVCALLVLSLAAGLSGLKKDPKGIVGKIDNKSYTFTEYNGILDNYYNFWQSREGRLSADRKKELNDRCWDELIGRAIYDKEIKRRGLRITDQQAHDSVIKNPPAQVKQLDALKKDGKFDLELFKKALEVDEQFRKSVYSLVKETMIYDRLFSVIKGEVKAKQDSVKGVWFKDNNLASARIIYFDYSKLPPEQVSDAEALTYYGENREKYLKDPARRYYFVKLGSEKYTKVKADSIHQALLAGTDFAELAKQYSQDPGSGQQGGDLGWFGRGRMVKPFEDTAFALADSAISPPIQSQFGWHIIQTLGHRRNDKGEEEVNARHILIKSEASDEAKGLIRQEADSLHALAAQKGLTRAAAELSLTVSETAEFYESDRAVREINSAPELVKEAFNNQLGYLPPVKTAQNGDCYVCELSDSLGHHYSPFDKEKAGIIRTLEKDKRVAANKAGAREFFETHKGSDYLAVAERDSLKIVEAVDIKEGSSIPEIGSVKVLTDSLLAASEGQFTSLVENETNAYLAKITKRTKPTETEWKKQQSKLMAEANDRVKNSHLNTWYYNQRQKMKIEDNRKEYYDLPQPQNRGQQIQLNPQ